MFKGIIGNEFGDIVGRYWFRSGSGTYTLMWHGIRRDGWTLEGIQAWADRLGYWVWPEE